MFELILNLSPVIAVGALLSAYNLNKQIDDLNDKLSKTETKIIRIKEKLTDEEIILKAKKIAEERGIIWEQI